MLGFHYGFLGGVGGKVSDERLDNGVTQVLSGADMIEVLARQNVLAVLNPVLLDQQVGVELVAVPCGEDQAARQLFQETREFGFIRFRPGVEVINMAPGVRRVCIDQVQLVGRVVRLICTGSAWQTRRSLLL